MTSMLSTASAPQLAPKPVLEAVNQPAAIRLMSLGLVWLTVASGAVVFAEPAPVDALTMALILALPVVGLVSMKPILIVLLSLWLIAGVSALIASTQAFEFGRAVTHSTVSIYLYLAFFILAAFIAKRPEQHTRLIMNAYVCAAILASTTAIIGYFNLLPGSYELFTKFGRAAGTFKDPNVFGPFLVPPLLYTLHLMVHRPLHQAVIPAGIFLFLIFAVLLSFSRGAWMNLAISGVVYGFFTFATAPTNLQRLKLILIASVGFVALIGVLVIAAQQPKISKLLSERAQVVQSYDAGPEGRFGGQSKAMALTPLKPFGIGALEFGERYHHEEAHNVYLTMMLQTGWIGGLIFIAITLLTICSGFAHVIRRSAMQPMIIIAFSAFVGLAVQGLTIDIDHWRHLYLVMAILWGLIASNEAGIALAARQQDKCPSNRRNDEEPWDYDAEGRRHQRIATILGPGHNTIANCESEPRRNRAHRPRRPQSDAYT